jgi:hypothetical protein
MECHGKRGLVEDNMRGLMYCDLLLHRVKSWRNHGSLQIDPFLAVSEVLMAIAKKGDPCQSYPTSARRP